MIPPRQLPLRLQTIRCPRAGQPSHAALRSSAPARARAWLYGVLMVLACAVPVGAQGQDDCANAQPISGLGSFAFDNSVAVMDGAADPLCDSFGTQDIDQDVWFAWTATEDGLHRLSTCNQSSVDTKIAVYDGSCSGVMLACNDDACGLQSEVTWSAVNGQSYILRVGTFPGAIGGLGQIVLSNEQPVVNPANGHYYQYISSGLDWAASNAEAQTLSYQGMPGHLVTIADAAENDFLVSTFGQRCWIGAQQDYNDPGYSEPSGGWVWVTGEPWTFDSWATGEPNDYGSGEDWAETWATGDWNDMPVSTGNVTGYYVEFDGGGDTFGTNYCIGAPNSTGAGASMSANGTANVADNNLTLRAESLPSNQMGIFFYGPAQILAPFGNGYLCVGAGGVGIFRLYPPLSTNGAGLLSRPVDYTNPPQPAAQITAGSTWNFQAWYRDPAAGGAGFNLSDGFEIVFSP
ncbi:MAG: hypothetical protein CMJ87_02440 [Planctomycetes bacterium]|nr:hypothetical protein [Planctomycetota bacterium]